MKVEIYINGIATEITLTSDQVKQLKKVDDRPIIERIDSLEAALAYNKKTQEVFDFETERDTDGQKAGKELEEIALALREGKELEMGAKWYNPWMRKPIAGSGSGFSFIDYLCDGGGSTVGARLSVDTADKAIYMGEKFANIYTRYMSPNK